MTNLMFDQNEQLYITDIKEYELYDYASLWRPRSANEWAHKKEMENMLSQCPDISSHELIEKMVWNKSKFCSNYMAVDITEVLQKEYKQINFSMVNVYVIPKQSYHTDEAPCEIGFRLHFEDGQFVSRIARGSIDILYRLIKHAIKIYEQDYKSYVEAYKRYGIIENDLRCGFQNILMDYALFPDRMGDDECKLIRSDNLQRNGMCMCPDF